MDLEAQRADVLRRLHAAVGDGTLAHDIAMSRLKRAEQAASVDELDVLVSGLGSGALPVAIEPYPVAATAPLTADPGSSAQSPIAFRSRWKGITKQGVWQIPPFLLVDPGYGSVTLDFMAAIPDATAITIKIIESAGWTKLIIPDGWGVNTDDLRRTWGWVSNEVDAVAEPGKPHVIVTGSLGSGYITIRHQKPRDRRRLEKYMAKEQRALEG